LNSQGLQLQYIPAFLANLTALEILDLDGDMHSDQDTVLGGPLPPQLSSLANMTSFGVTGPVNGTIPATYSAWTKLSAFRVSRTALGGTIPPSLFASWLALTAFSIEGAQITGTIPPMFNNTLLKEFVVERTPVSNSGTLPAWFMDARAVGLKNMQQLGFGEWEGSGRDVAGRLVGWPAGYYESLHMSMWLVPGTT
jgi:hypothetical protein